ncbi:hypothetical protein Tco_0678113 [Tanacetum coccineum]|uniref:Uncharacterized protein n=1 Tax=Tanacetum coccineum TaxID=301880 RepID=A0ABQ4XE63_9ASTR
MERYKADIVPNNFLLQGIKGLYYSSITILTQRHLGNVEDDSGMDAELTRDDRRNLCLYDVFLNTSVKIKEKTIKDTTLVSESLSSAMYPTQSSKSPQSSTEPYPSDNFQMDSGSSSTENLIESLSNSLALLTQSYKSHLPQTNNFNCLRGRLMQEPKEIMQEKIGEPGMWEVRTEDLALLILWSHHPDHVHDKSFIGRSKSYDDAGISGLKYLLREISKSIQEKDNVIRHLKDLVANVNEGSCEPYNAKDVTALIEQNDCVRVDTSKMV